MDPESELIRERGETGGKKEGTGRGRRGSSRIDAGVATIRGDGHGVSREKRRGRRARRERERREEGAARSARVSEAAARRLLHVSHTSLKIAKVL